MSHAKYFNSSITEHIVVIVDNKHKHAHFEFIGLFSKESIQFHILKIFILNNDFKCFSAIIVWRPTSPIIISYFFHLVINFKSYKTGFTQLCCLWVRYILNHNLNRDTFKAFATFITPYTTHLFKYFSYVQSFLFISHSVRLFSNS